MINTIVINGTEYEIVDKASRDMLMKINEPYLPNPSIKTEQITSFSESIIDGFEVLDYPYFYFTSTSKDRVLYTKAGNTILLNKVFLTEHLSNLIKDLNEGEVITIHYGE